MEGYPKKLLDFERRFRSEDACRQYLLSLRWPGGFTCPRCSGKQAWKTSRGLWKCGSCKKNVSVTAGTVFERSKVPLRLWFRAAWWLTNQKSGMSALGLQRALGIGSYETAWAMLHKLRRTMVRVGREKLTRAVEVDETIVGGRQRQKQGKRLAITFKKATVVVAAEIRGDQIGRIRMREVPESSKKELIGFITENVKERSKVITDGWPGYLALKEKGYRHRPIVQNGRSKEDLDWVLPRVHRVASLLKRWLMGTHQGRVERKHLKYYLDEFVFRFNRRSSPDRGMLFHRLMQQAVVSGPILISRL